MKYLRITNAGEIEPQALHLVGASTKRNDASKIGQFGSGNKYAMAYLLRNGYGLRVFSGENEIPIETKPEEFRDNTYNLIYIAGEKTSITTEMGKDWSFWQAMREIYCNAIDEGGHSIDFVQEIKPESGVTQFYILNKGDAMDFIHNFDNYFAINKKVLFECPVGRILEKSGTTANIYRKGIRCSNSSKPSCYDYDFNEIMINEDRIVMYGWQVEEKIWDLIYQCTDKEVIRNILIHSGNGEYVEGSLSDISRLSTDGISEEFKQVVSDIKIAPKGLSGLLDPDEFGSTTIIPTKIFESVRAFISDDNVAHKFKMTNAGALFRKIERTLLHNETMRKAMDFLNEAGYEIPYEIHLCVFDEKNVLGCAFQGEIYISDVCMEMGVSQVVNTIIEEYIHIKYECQDKTRKMQTAIITELVSYMQKVNSYAI